MQSWERAVFSPRFLGYFIKQAARKSVKIMGWRNPLGRRVSVKYRPLLFFGFVLCVVGRFAC